ncbi:MAG: hypothetical protein MI724_14265, partial [Spirochaetales bacterium]|nr:hypothetical protein [Spirochaetales bacterium]
LFFDLYRTLAVGIGCRWSLKRGRIAALAAGALLLTLLYVAALASAAAELVGRVYTLPPILVTFGSRAFSAIVAAGAFFAIFRAAAGRPLKTGRTIAIALGAAIVWRVLFTAGGATVRVAGSRFVAYGVMAWAVVFLTFMRLMAEILLFSAILIREFALPSESTDSGGQAGGDPRY